MSRIPHLNAKNQNLTRLRASMLSCQVIKPIKHRKQYRFNLNWLCRHRYHSLCRRNQIR